MFLEQQRPTQALYAYMNELRAAAGDVRIELDPPRTPVAVDDDDPALGPAAAPIAIVEYSDFQCPYCQQLTGTIERLQAAYGDDVRLVFKDYPLPNHAQAFKAAEAGHCAHEQDKFWELHDTMFANQDALAVEDLKRHAGALGMDQAAFDACLDSGRHAARVNGNLREGQEHGVQSTPTVFINGRTVLGAAPYVLFEQIIEEELERARQQARAHRGCSGPACRHAERIWFVLNTVTGAHAAQSRESMRFGNADHTNERINCAIPDSGSSCTAPGFLDTRLRYAAWRSSYSSRASSGVRYASFSRRQHWL